MWKQIAGAGLAFAMLATVSADDSAETPDVTVEFCGRLRHGVMVIGGECTGTTIAVERVTWEIQLTNDAQRQFAQQNHKKTVVVIGSLKKVAGIETKDRWIIDAKKLELQDPIKNKQGVRMMIVGKLQPANPKQTTPSLITIHSNGQVWPIELPTDSKMKTTATSLIGETVWLMGSLKQPPKQALNQSTQKAGSGVSPILQVSILKRPEDQPPE